jgi:hypothetical protein
MTELHKFIEHLKESGLGEDGFTKEMWIAIVDYFHKKETINYTHTFEVDLNSVKRQEQYNKQIEQIHNAPCKTYIFDGEKYIELKP